MSRKQQQAKLKFLREKILLELEDFYKHAFENISDLELGEGDIAKLAQILLQSKDGALTPLKNEIEKPLITKAPLK
ncbi:hercynine metabolism small protein [Prochlorococcus marinus]|uniref:Uncharacterized protein n=1 Tax=Prochlorococcus marinus (strain MIT 9211) TaxID=93059 RepID=A9BD60_PROM4|nr:hercynine metabolism small protein [Prochlorococcus marinus]ABX09673.1 Hypothetical protein P9211_17421 [Prochlorococcus marinus str. MIT 9211]